MFNTFYYKLSKTGVANLNGLVGHFGNASHLRRPHIKLYRYLGSRFRPTVDIFVGEKLKYNEVLLLYLSYEALSIQAQGT